MEVFSHEILFFQHNFAKVFSLERLLLYGMSLILGQQTNLIIGDIVRMCLITFEYGNSNAILY